ncbi:hypothetical protein SAMN06272735_8741 [Streptomyces sp. TLI_55]|nr:hypothetical protein SAMN06272735_8741 [Streptomyces sp. TLI_55]
MVSLTHIRVRAAEKRRAHSRRASDEHVSGERATAEQIPRRGPVSEGGHDWPTDTQVWGWAESTVLAGYGPGPASLL